MSRHIWTAEELATLRARYPDERTETLAAALGLPVAKVYAKANNLGLHKSAAYLASPDACRLRRGDQVGAAHRFTPGIVPWNKGKHYVAGGRSAETRFKPGQRGNKFAPIGSERVLDGYRQRKVTDTGYPPRDWVPVHVLLWRQHHGDIPPDHVVCFIDGDKTHIAIDNLELVSRVDLMRRNTRHRLPKPLADIIAMRAALNRKINQITRRNTDEHPEQHD